MLCGSIFSYMVIKNSLRVLVLFLMGLFEMACFDLSIQRQESCLLQRIFLNQLGRYHMRKDNECTFGILKKRWRILEFGTHFQDIAVVEKSV